MAMAQFLSHNSGIIPRAIYRWKHAIAFCFGDAMHKQRLVACQSTIKMGMEWLQYTI